MINPLELRVSLNALPQQAPVAAQEQAGVHYRQLQDLKDIVEITREQDTRIAEMKDDLPTAFTPVENPGEDSDRKEELFRRQREKSEQNIAELKEYQPEDGSSLRSFSNPDVIGLNLDLIA